MSKALEYLEEIKSYFPFVDLGKGKEYVCEKEFNTIKQALQRLESIENANPSEALKCLECLYCEPVDYRSNDKANDYKTIQQALIKAEKDEKIILGIEDYLNLRIKVSPLGDVRKAFIEIRNQLNVIKEVLE